MLLQRLDEQPGPHCRVFASENTSHPAVWAHNTYKAEKIADGNWRLVEEITDAQGVVISRRIEAEGLTEVIATGRATQANLELLQQLQGKLEIMAESQLLPKYRELDPNLKWGYTGSFKTGKVGNQNKPTFGKPIDLSEFDVDLWIESDILNEKFGSNLRADVEFRKLLSNTPGFEGLRHDKKVFSILFKRSAPK